MKRSQVIEIIKRLVELKTRSDLKIIDAHVHPLDVLGVMPHPALAPAASLKTRRRDPFRPGLVERLYGGRINRKLGDLCFRFLPGHVRRSLRRVFVGADAGSLSAEMDAAGVDQVALLPVEPWLPTEVVGRGYGREHRFFILGSLDLETLTLPQIEAKIQAMMARWRIIGLKLHPNVQNFMPQPAHNPRQLAEKLDLIYAVAARENLFLLFHGGSSGYPGPAHPSHEARCRGLTKGLLTNFCDADGRSEILSRYGGPMIIAHLGHLGASRPDFGLLKAICRRHDQVYFDTALMPAEFIKGALKTLPLARIIFGSDGVYARLSHSLAAVYAAAAQVAGGEKLEGILRRVLAENFLELLGRRASEATRPKAAKSAL